MLRSTPPSTVRALWSRIETVHAVTYFASESRAAAAGAGLKGFWMGYFGFRAAPLGTVGPALVEATFFNFAPRMVRRSIPDAWRHAPPSALVDARAGAAAAALRAVAPGADDVARSVAGGLEAAVEHGSSAGRPMFAANRSLPLHADPVAALWQHCTSLREHRGDGHVAALLVADVDGCEAHVLFAAERGVPVEVLRDNRGWTPEEWAAATERLAARDLVSRDGAVNDAGRALRRRIEADTDRLAAEAFADVDHAALLADLDPLARAIAGSGVIPFPNPMGLAPPDGEDDSG